MPEPIRPLSGPDEAIETLGERLSPVDTEAIRPSAGRVLAEPIWADRDSPAADVSAMDGYAARLTDLSEAGELEVTGEIAAGAPSGPLPVGGVVRVFTGAIVPSGAEVVIRREDVSESSHHIRWADVARQQPAGANIRRRGENAKAGSAILAAGTCLNAASIAAAANFGAARVTAFRRVTVSVIVTGNELLGVEESPQPWQLRDSNGPTVAAMVEARPWIELKRMTRCGDQPAALRQLLERCLDDSDAVILTGGVSKGDHDHVPGVLAAAGCETLFHRLPIRPGQPVLGAVAHRGQLVLGLPGNPVSTACCLMRIGLPLLTKLGGRRDWRPQPLAVTVANPDDKTLPLHWMRLVILGAATPATGPTQVERITSQGSGDLVSLGRSEGFIEQPPGESGPGPWPFFPW
ncbi:MAG: molybdopterin molybdenumtransferase MoeA [Planctomycetaceae bacterium]|nr:MAG: molybdopterin molybdenumtransferase MoeA [Planctomycetaceae bacterium]